MDALLAIETARLKVRQAYLPRFRQVLRVKPAAQYFQAENKTQAAVSYELTTENPPSNEVGGTDQAWCSARGTP